MIQRSVITEGIAARRFTAQTGGGETLAELSSDPADQTFSTIWLCRPPSRIGFGRKVRLRSRLSFGVSARLVRALVHVLSPRTVAKMCRSVRQVKRLWVLRIRCAYYLPSRKRLGTSRGLHPVLPLQAGLTIVRVPTRTSANQEAHMSLAARRASVTAPPRGTDLTVTSGLSVHAAGGARFFEIGKESTILPRFLSCRKF